jgi:hypothetical protein
MQTYIHDQSGIQTHDPSVRTEGDNTYPRRTVALIGKIFVYISYASCKERLTPPFHDVFLAVVVQKVDSASLASRSSCVWNGGSLIHRLFENLVT